jgi:hypothetical protein
VYCHVFVSLLISIYPAKARQSHAHTIIYWSRTVFGDIVQVISSDDNGSGHLRRHDFAG